MRLRLMMLFTASVLCLSGCGGGSTTHDVSGKVTYNGEAVTEGYIAFVPEEGGKGGGGPITNGTYSVQAQSGKNRVEITATKKMKLPPGEVGMDGEKEEVRQYIPEKYNTKTELKLDVTESITKDFELKK